MQSKSSACDLRVCILTLENQVVEEKLEQLPNEKTLQGLRVALIDSELGKPEKEIFYPNWTNSVYMMLSNGDPNPDDFRKEEHLIKDDKELLSLLETVNKDDQKQPILLLQQTRAKRYRNKSKPSGVWKEATQRQILKNWVENGGYEFLPQIPMYPHYAPATTGISYYHAPAHHHMYPGYPFHPSTHMGMMNMNTTFYNAGIPVQYYDRM